MTLIFGVSALVAFALLSHDAALAASPSRILNDERTDSASSPLPPRFAVNPDGSVDLRICFNWTCSNVQALTFSANDMAGVKQHLAMCSGSSLHDRLQRLRIGIWQMELLAQKHQPLLSNDLAINDYEHGVEGRTDCVDNTSNTTTFLSILQAVKALPEWSVSAPEVRNLFDITLTHWTAVVTDEQSGEKWSVDSWYHPHGHLPLVLPLDDWADEEMGWEPPFDRFNPYPRFTNEFCRT